MEIMGLASGNKQEVDNKNILVSCALLALAMGEKVITKELPKY